MSVNGDSLDDSTGSPRWRGFVRPSTIAILLIGIHAMLLAWSSVVHSPNWDEMAHLPSGMSHWHTGQFDLYRVNPPLVRMLAAAPVAFSGAKLDLSQVYDAPYGRPEFPLGRRFVNANGFASFWYFTLARWAVIPLCLVGPWVCYLWANELFGWRSALVAVTLYCFSPNMLAWGASITPDAAAASLGVLAGYMFWKWLREPTVLRAIGCGLSLGVLELAKTTWIILFVLWPLLWVVWRIVGRMQRHRPSQHADARDEPVPSVQQLGVILLLDIYVINLGYGFEGWLKPLGEYQFISRTLTAEDRPDEGGNRFAGTWLSAIPIPLPENYVRGIDIQRYDFEQKKWSYLRGEQRRGGWWYYYLYGLLVKTPVGTIGLAALAVGLALRRGTARERVLDVVIVLAPAIAVLILVSSQTGFSRHLRYILPAIPFLFVVISSAGMVIGRRSLICGVVVVALTATVVESLAVFPHSLSFFNTLAGGPTYGAAHLLDSNIDWGQDLLFLKQWYDTHPKARPFYLAYFGGIDVDPHVSRMDWKPIPSGTETEPLPPGWYAVSVNHVHGYHHFEHDRPLYTRFQKLEPVTSAGYSILIYHVTGN